MRYSDFSNPMTYFDILELKYGVLNFRLDMGDIADWHREQIMDQNADIQDAINDMNDNQLVNTLFEVLDSPDYEENDFTEMVRNIGEKAKASKRDLSAKQRNVVAMHVKINSGIWY